MIGSILVFVAITWVLYRLEHGFPGYPIARDAVIVGIVPLYVLAAHLAQLSLWKGGPTTGLFTAATGLCVLTWWWRWQVFAVVAAAYGLTAALVASTVGVGWPLLLVYAGLTLVAEALTIASRGRRPVSTARQPDT